MNIQGLSVELTCAGEPVQYEGSLDGLAVVFRARHGKWQFGVALDPTATIDDAYSVSTGSLDGFRLNGSARIVFPPDAEPIFTDCVQQFRASRASRASEAGRVPSQKPIAPLMDCKGLSSRILSLHTRSADRDEAFGHLYCTKCKVHLPEEEDMSMTAMQLFIEAVWWRWKASNEPPTTIFTHFCQIANEASVTVSANIEGCIKEHLRNRLGWQFQMSLAEAAAAVNTKPARQG